MSYRQTEHPRVPIANERNDGLALVASIVVKLPAPRARWPRRDTVTGTCFVQMA